MSTITAVRVSHPEKADFLVYDVHYSSGRSALMTDRTRLPATVRKFLLQHSAAAHTVRVPHLENHDIKYTYYVIYK